MSTTAQKIAIIGANQAGLTAAATLRNEGFKGTITVLEQDREVPYDRPPLSKAYLKGEVARDQIRLRSKKLLDTLDLDLRLGCAVTAIDLARQSVTSQDGHDVPYDRLLLTTGARNRELPIPGLQLSNVYSLRTLRDADKLKPLGTPGRHAVILGMGFIGSEIAAALLTLGLEVTIIEALDGPLIHALGPELSSSLKSLHQAKGAKMHFGETVVRIEPVGDQRRVVTSRGTSITCDFVVYGFGTTPNSEIAEQAGLTTNNGVLVNEKCETSAPNVYAAGDVASMLYPMTGEHRRVEHWLSAQQMGTTAAKNMLGMNTNANLIPWFWSDQYDSVVHYAGFHTSWDRLVTRGEVTSEKYAVFHLRDERIVGVAAFNDPITVRQTMPLIQSGQGVRLEVLADTTQKVGASVQ